MNKSLTTKEIRSLMVNLNPHLTPGYTPSEIKKMSDYKLMKLYTKVIREKKKGGLVKKK